MVPRISRRDNCLDNAVAESFFSALKKERIRRRGLLPPRTHSIVFKRSTTRFADMVRLVACSLPRLIIEQSKLQ